MWPGCPVSDMEHENMCCPAHFVRLPSDISLRLLFPNNPDEDWLDVESEVQKWAVEICLQPTSAPLIVALAENIKQRALFHRRIEIGQITLPLLEARL